MWRLAEQYDFLLLLLIIVQRSVMLQIKSRYPLLIKDRLHCTWPNKREKLICGTGRYCLVKITTGTKINSV